MTPFRELRGNAEPVSALPQNSNPPQPPRLYAGVAGRSSHG